MRILVAEDNLVNQKLARKILERIGHKVTIAKNGARSSRVLEKENFDVVFMDLQMPEMDGLTATSEIRNRKHLANQRIYAMTAHAMTGDREVPGNRHERLSDKAASNRRAAESLK